MHDVPSTEVAFDDIFKTWVTDPQAKNLVKPNPVVIVREHCFCIAKRIYTGCIGNLRVASS